MSDAETLDDIPWGDEPEERVKLAAPRKCRRHEWIQVLTATWRAGPPEISDSSTEILCKRCGRVRDDSSSRRGRNNRKRGNSHELAIARRYGGDKVGPLGLPEDIRGARWISQVKTHQGTPPARWTAIFSAMDASKGQRVPRLILRYLRGPGQKPLDFIVVRGDDWLEEFGRDEEAA